MNNNTITLLEQKIDDLVTRVEALECPPQPLIVGEDITFEEVKLMLEARKKIKKKQKKPKNLNPCK